MRLYFVTGNRHKLEEARLALRDCNAEIELVQADAPKLEIQSMDVREVARVAALTAYLHLGKPLVVEDTGLYINALNGFPGAYAAHVYKTIGLRGVLKLLEGVEDRRARFVAAVAAVIPPRIYVVEGVVEGRITEEPRGSHGFGYDPIFEPEGYNKTFAEMSIEEKSRISHRARAFKKLCKVLEVLEESQGHKG